MDPPLLAVQFFFLPLNKSNTFLKKRSLSKLKSLNSIIFLPLLIKNSLNSFFETFWNNN